MFPIKQTSSIPCVRDFSRVMAPDAQGDSESFDSEAYEQLCAILERNEPAAKRRAHENEYWRQRTSARRLQSQPDSQTDSDLQDLTVEDFPLEPMNVKHRIRGMLNVFIDEYNRVKPSGLFLDWVSSMNPVTQTSIIQKVMTERGHLGNVKPAWVRTFNRSLRFMNGGERSSYQIRIKNGLLYQNGAEFDTSKMKTRYSGTGVAIFVQSHDGTFYSSSHLGGVLPDVSPSSGPFCRSAGEWKVEKGRIEWISRKSECFQPTMEQLVNAIRDLSFQKALNQTKARICEYQEGTETSIDATGLTSDPH